jgi:hypothetical protein
MRNVELAEKFIFMANQSELTRKLLLAERSTKKKIKYLLLFLH